MGGEVDRKVPITQKDFSWRNAGDVERRVRVDWELVRKRAD